MYTVQFSGTYSLTMPHRASLWWIPPIAQTSRPRRSTPLGPLQRSPPAHSIAKRAEHKHLGTARCPTRCERRRMPCRPVPSRPHSHSLSLSSRLSSSPSFFFPPSHLSLLCVLLHHIHPSLVALDAVQPSNACLLSALPSQPPPSPTLNPPTFVLFPNVPGLD